MEYVKLGDYCIITSSKRIFANQYVSKGVPFFRSKEIIEKNNSQNISEPLYISTDVYNEIKNKFGVPQIGDVLLTSVGTLGIPYLVKEESFYFKDGNLTWMKDFSKKLSSKYLYYWLSSSFGRISLLQRAIGSSQPAITIEILKKYKIILPSINTQHRIASILSAYDNLIENNNKRIRLLEQMAENLYKVWFSYHRIKPISSEISLTDIVSITRGLSYSSEEIDCDEGNDLINLKNIQAYGGFRLDGTKKYSGKHKKEQIVIEGDLVMGVTDMTQDRRTVGSVALIPNTINLSVISADLIKLTSTIDNVFLYAMFRWGGVSKYISQFANGANVLHLRPQALKNVKILLPSNVFIDKYVSIVKPMIATINKLNTENEQLSRQRDLLLPRLMSGKLEV